MPEPLPQRDPMKNRQPPGSDVPRDRPVMRVILVGRTGLESRLRTDPELMVVRARTRMDAIGELSEPCSPGQRSVVVVGSEPGANHAAKTETDFVDGLRSVEPQVRVFGLTGDEAPAYDGAVPRDADGETLRAALRRCDEPHPPMVEIPVQRDEPALIDSIRVGRKPGADLGDESVVRALIAGADPVEPALEIIRRRLGGRDVAYLPAGHDEPGAAAVTWRGRHLGRLRSAEVPLEQLAPHAAWLGAWIALRDQQAQLRDAAFTDCLTGAYNRRFFDKYLGAAVKQAADKRHSVTVMVFDVDDFKNFNDRYGHAAGDDILRETVKLLTSVIRPSDRVCRIGGDEFAVIFHEPRGPRNPTSKPPSSVFEIARRFQRAICEQRFPKLGLQAPGTLTISGGLATYPWDGRTAEELVTRADELALQSKRQGKNAITFGPGAERVCGTPGE